MSDLGWTKRHLTFPSSFICLPHPWVASLTLRITTKLEFLKTWQDLHPATSPSRLSTYRWPSPHFGRTASLSSPPIDHTPFWLRAFTHSVPSDWPSLLSVLPASLFQLMTTLPSIPSDSVTYLQEPFLIAKTRSAAGEHHSLCLVHLSQFVMDW